VVHHPPIEKAHGVREAFLPCLDVSDLVGLCWGAGGRDAMAEA
jgi:hypothetical protein